MLYACVQSKSGVTDKCVYLEFYEYTETESIVNTCEIPSPVLNIL